MDVDGDVLGFDPRFQCTATSKQSQKRCKRRAAPGQRVCHMHGAASPLARRAADFRGLLTDLEAEAKALHPTDVLLNAVHRCAAMVQLLGAEVAAMADGAFEETRGVVSAADSYGQWIDRAARAAKMALDAGISERLVRLEEVRGRMIAELFRQVFADVELGLNDEQQTRARAIAARHMRALGTGAA